MFHVILLIFVWSVGLVSSQTTFQCPLSTQTPVLNAAGTSLFCTQPGQVAECPVSAICSAALNSGGSVNICCASSTTTTPPPSSIPVCPNNGIPQPSNAIYVPCLQNSPSTCETDFTCVQSANIPTIFLCCASDLVQFPTCPSNLALYTENGRARYCLNAQSTNCPVGYSCQLAVGTPSTFVCCSTSPSSSDCPVNYTPVQSPSGTPTTCSPLSPAACPSGSLCIQSIRSATTFVCCVPSTTPRVCPNNGNALLNPTGNVQTCTTVGVPCSTPGYTCQLSTVLAQFICCSSSATTLTCADGRQVYQPNSGTPPTCNPSQSPSTCPSGYDCAQSTTPSTFVCCLSGSGSPQGCPVGWNPYIDTVTSAVRTCSAISDTTCPYGFSCVPSSSSLSSFLCCRLSNSLICSSGRAYLLNGLPRLCSTTALNACPVNYSCSPSTTSGVTICCSQSLSPGFPRFSPSSSSTLPSACLASPTPLSDGEPIPCTSSFDCPAHGFYCSTQTSNGGRICCSQYASSNFYRL